MTRKQFWVFYALLGAGLLTGIIRAIALPDPRVFDGSAVLAYVLVVVAAIYGLRRRPLKKARR